MNINVLIGVMIPFVGTSLGAACVFLLRKEMNATVQKTMLGFASGVMVAASVWSLLIPAINMSEPMGKLSFVPAATGFLMGILFLLVLDRVVPICISTRKNRKVLRATGKNLPCFFWQ